jgi:hypothetical protein
MPNPVKRFSEAELIEVENRLRAIEADCEYERSRTVKALKKDPYYVGPQWLSKLTQVAEDMRRLIDIARGFIDFDDDDVNRFSGEPKQENSAC